MNAPTSPLARGLAFLLAVGGCLWGFLLWPLFLLPDGSPLNFGSLAPGYVVYVVTGSLIVRAVSTPPPGARLVIWLNSLLAQGAWLIYVIWVVLEKLAAGRSAARELMNPMFAWLILATAASAAGLLADLPGRAEPEPPASDVAAPNPR